MKAAVSTTLVPDADYLALVEKFPLRPLRSKSEHDLAIQAYAPFAGRIDLSGGENDYVDALTHFIEEYESRSVRSEMLKLTPLDLLKHLMELHDMSTTDLGYAVGSRGLASEILNAKRGISRQVAAKLGKRFALAPEVFIRFD